MTTPNTAPKHAPPIDASNLTLLLSARMDELHNVPLVVKIADTPHTVYRFVHFSYHDAVARTLHLRATTGIAYLDEMLHPLTRTDAGLAKKVLLQYTDPDGAEKQALITGLDEKQHYRDKTGEHPAVLLSIADA